MDDTLALVQALRALVPAALRDVVEVGARQIGDDDWTTLHSTERSLVGRSIEQRRREFATGRRLLRDLLVDDRPIGRRRNGAPQLPDGAVGSLAHDRKFAVAAVSRHDGSALIGIDIELADSPLSRADVHIIVRDDDVSPAPLAAFVMKEATYKAWSRSAASGHTHRVLEHSDVRVLAQGDAFTATVLVDGTTFDGRFTETSGRWLALVIASGDPPTR